MTEYNFDEIDMVVSESVTEDDIDASADISISTPVGRFVCEIIECKPVEKEFKAYSCYAASLSMKIKEIIEIEQPVTGEDGKPIQRKDSDGVLEIVKRKLPIAEADKAKYAMVVGQILKDDINLYSDMEKESMRKRRLFVAQKIGILDNTTGSLTGSSWKLATGKHVIVETELNSYKNNTGDIVKNVRVAWAGYESVSNQPGGVAVSDAGGEVDYGDI